MINYLLRRVVYGILILLGVNLITFVLFFAVNTPDDMARLNLGGAAGGPGQTSEGGTRGAGREHEAGGGGGRGGGL